MSDQIELAPDYYLDNFLKLTQHANDWYLDFLTDSELSWLSRFDAITHPTKCLLVRLLSRKGCWFRSDKLNYAEIPNLDSALLELQNHGFIHINDKVSQRLLAETLLTKTELCTQFSVSNKSLRKELLLAELSDDVFDQFSSLHFDIIELLDPQFIEVLLTLFFANTHQDLSQFVLDDLGLNCFEDYQLSQQRRFFQSRSQVDQLLSLADIQSQYLNANRKESIELLRLLEALPQDIEHPYIARKRQHLINDLARDLERLELCSDALDWFQKTELPPTLERQARIYDKINDINGMSDIVTQMLEQPHDVAEYEVALKLKQRLRRKLGEKVPRQPKPKLDEYHLSLDLSSQRVELAVKQYFESLGYQVFYAENALLNGLFGLTFWDAIFAPIEGAFINQYQHRPLDLYHADFAEKRDSIIRQAFVTLETEGLSTLHQTYVDKVGISNPFVHWGVFDQSLLSACIDCMPASLISELFSVMLTDLKLYRNGMPDLMLFKDGQYEWVEVKGPGDKLQDNQWRWIEQFLALDVNMKVCYVKAL